MTLQSQRLKVYFDSIQDVVGATVLAGGTGYQIRKTTKGMKLLFQAINAQGDEKDISLFNQVTLKMKDRDGTVKSFVCTITDSNAGQFEYTLLANDLNAQKVYRCQVQLEHTVNGLLDVSREFIIDVTELIS